MQVVDECTAAHEKLDFLQAGRVAYDFFWNQFADWYVEASKTRLYGQDAARAAAARQVIRRPRQVCCVQALRGNWQLHSDGGCGAVRSTCMARNNPPSMSQRRDLHAMVTRC